MEQQQTLCQNLEKYSIPYVCDEPLAKHTSFRIGGPAKVLCTPADGRQLIRAPGLCGQLGVRRYLLGKGSNVLFSDAGFDGAVICTAAFSGAPRLGDDGIVEADAGLGLNQLCRAAQAWGLTGLEFAYGIPGSVGGAVYMNAGAYGGELKDRLLWAESPVLQGHLHHVPAEKLELSYRHSCFMLPEYAGACIVRAAFLLEQGD